MQSRRSKRDPPSELWGRVRDNLRDDVIKCLALLGALIDPGEAEDLKEGVYDQGSPFLDVPLLPL